MASFFDGLELLPGEVVRCSEDAGLSAALLNGPRPKSLYVPVHVVVTNARLVLRPATPDAAAALRWPVALPLAGLDTVTFDQVRVGRQRSWGEGGGAALSSFLPPVQQDQRADGGGEP